ncbi:hypothetical protein EIM50_10225 [Pseudoxanthomonas sp. SGD-10]|nr:hypothetical protein EIM50_10225 [Pseudoxanthomonas sp. SGD-10]
MSNPPKERRRSNAPVDPQQLVAGLTPGQQATVETMRHFHWELRFVRRPLFQPPIPFLFDRDGKRYVVLREDGSIDEHPDLPLRD